MLPVRGAHSVRAAILAALLPGLEGSWAAAPRSQRPRVRERLALCNLQGLACSLRLQGQSRRLGMLQLPQSLQVGFLATGPAEQSPPCGSRSGKQVRYFTPCCPGVSSG